jgi:hypothetical protein
MTRLRSRELTASNALHNLPSPVAILTFLVIYSPGPSTLRADPLAGTARTLCYITQGPARKH